MLQTAARKLLGSPVLHSSPPDDRKSRIPSDKRKGLLAAFRAAAVRVTTILLADFDTAEVTRTLEYFPNLRRVELTGPATFAASALTQYGAMEHLDIHTEETPFHISTGARPPTDYDGSSDSEDSEASEEIIPPILDLLWGTAAWSSAGSLRSICFCTDVLRQTDWSFIEAFSGSLQSIVGTVVPPPRRWSSSVTFCALVFLPPSSLATLSST